MNNFAKKLDAYMGTWSDEKLRWEIDYALDNAAPAAYRAKLATEMGRREKFKIAKAKIEKLTSGLLLVDAKK